MRVCIDDCARKLGVEQTLVIEVGELGQSAQGDVLAELRAEIEQECRTAAAFGHFAEAVSGLFQRMGYPDVAPAGIKLRERVAMHGFKRISPMVDAYNLVSARFAYGIGAHDAVSLDDRAILRVRRAVDGDCVVPLSSNKPKRIPAGDLIYTADDRTVAWLGKRDVDSDEFKLSGATARAFFVLLGAPGLEAAELGRVAGHLIENVLRAFPGALVTQSAAEGSV